MTACIYCDSSLAGRGNPIRMTRHLALYCLAVPRAVKAKAAHAVNKPPAAASINPSVGNQASSIVSDDIKMEDYADHGDDWASSDGSEDEGQQDKSRILAVLSPIQSEVHRSPHLAEKEQDGLLLSQYLAPTTDVIIVGLVAEGDCNMMTTQEISAFYANLHTNVSAKFVKKHRVKTSATAASVQAMLVQQTHPLFGPPTAPLIPFGRLSRANSVDSLHADTLTSEEVVVKGLNARCDHDTTALFVAIQAFQASCSSQDEFCHGLAHYRRAVKLWSHHLATCNAQLDSIPKLLTAKAGVAAAKFAYRHPTMDARLSQLHVAKVLEEGTPFYARAFSQHMTLLAKQQAWDESLLCKGTHDTAQPSAFVDRSVVETIFNLVALAPFFDENLVLEAVQLADLFQVHPKQFWWTVVRSCVTTNQGELLLWMMPDMPIVSRKEHVQAFVDAQQFETAKRIAGDAKDPAEQANLLDVVQRAVVASTLQPDMEPPP
ncbi:hypothetical protein DYB38_003666, partial [Aphanomyces astaci]